MTAKQKQPVKLLVVDWDYFFQDLDGSGDAASQLYDWGHRESEFFIEAVWTMRASGFLRHGMTLPSLTGEQRQFWDRVRIDPKAKLYYHESNCMAAHVKVAKDVDEVWLYDAHHDAGYAQDDGLSRVKRNREIYKLASEGRWTCDNWMVYYHALQTKLHVRYPSWKTWAFQNEPPDCALVPDKALDRQPDRYLIPDVTFNRVFVCRSGAWVPPWNNADREFNAFLRNAPVADRIAINDQLVRTRIFSEEAAQAEADFMNRAVKEFETLKNLQASFDGQPERRS